jgi:DNA-binding transcriptional regulator YdaS (Cro superfamily)
MAMRNRMWNGTFREAALASAIRELPKIDRLKAVIELAESKERHIAARACAMNLATELFRQQRYELVPEVAKRYGLSRADLDKARKAARKPAATAKKATESEISAVIREYIKEDTPYEYASKVHDAVNALVEEAERIPLRNRNR